MEIANDDNDRLVEELRFKSEGQTFDRKSARIKAKDLAVPIIAMANADGGEIAIGIEDNGDVTGVDGDKEHINDLIYAPTGFCFPPPVVLTRILPCKDLNGRQNHVILMEVSQSPHLVQSRSGEAYCRIGDKSVRLGLEERERLHFSKGEAWYEDMPARGSAEGDLDWDKIRDYIKRIGYMKSEGEFLSQNGFITGTGDGGAATIAAALLFGKDPQKFLPRAYVRFLRYEGSSEQNGTELNVVKDAVFGGTVLEMIRKSEAFISTLMREYSFLGQDGVFTRIPEYPTFCWMELLVNAVAHRDYSILGTPIEIKMFDDLITFLSLGSLPGMVRPSNIRRVHFSRNPKIVKFLHDYGLVKEFGEGVDRIYKEMEQSGGKAPVFEDRDSFVSATLYGLKREGKSVPAQAADFSGGPARHFQIGKSDPQNSTVATEDAPKERKTPHSSNQREEFAVRRKRLLDAMVQNRAYTFTDLARMLMLKERRARDLVALLEQNGDIRREGRSHATRYFLIKGSAEEGKD